jgi:hypothetical protein
MDWLAEQLNWLSTVGTNDLVTGIWENNWIILSAAMAIIGAWLKGKCPEFWAKLSTMVPGVGKPNNRIL